MEKIESLTVQCCGGAGDGSVVTGLLIAKSMIKMGYHVLIHDTFPAEIRGLGKTVSEVRVSVREETAKADNFDVLLALNAAYSLEQLGHLKRDGIIIFDSAALLPDRVKRTKTCYGLPLENIAAGVTGKKLGKNVVATGFLAKILNLDPKFFLLVLEGLFGKKGRKVVKGNKRLFLAGYRYEMHISQKMVLKSSRMSKDKISVVSGNMAMAKGALNAGLSFFAGYPITPATKIMEYLALEMPKRGGIMLQTEDEIAALGAVVGAWFAGKRAMTATSGPGFSLMSEMLNLAVMTETPLVVINVMRGGPSTGLPTKVEQSDLNMALYGGHGDSPRVILAASTIKECYSIAQDAFDVAEKYQIPVVVLSDKFLAMSHIDLPEKFLREKRKRRRVGYRGKPENYKRYKITETGVSPWVVPGEADCFYTVTGLEHNEYGHPNYDPDNHAKMTEKRLKKLKYMLNDLPKPLFFGKKKAPNLIITWGSSFGAVLEASNRLIEEGYAIRLMNLRTIFPQHETIIRKALLGAEKVIIPEQNALGQLAKIIKGIYGREADEVHLPGGVPSRPMEVADLLRKRLKK